MFRKRILFGVLCLSIIFSFSNISVFATEMSTEKNISEEDIMGETILKEDLLFEEMLEEMTPEENFKVINKPQNYEMEDMGWIRLTCSVPKNFPGTVKVIIYEVEEQEEISFFLRPDTEYSSLEPLAYGTYKIANVSVSGGAEGCFETSFSTDAFTVNETNENPVTVPVYVGIAEEMQGTEDNKYLGMTYEEIMAEIKGTDVESDISDISENSTIKEEPVIEGETEEEYYENVKEYVEDNTELKKMEEKENRDFIFGFGVMMFLLMFLGIVFYFYKKNREL